MIEQHTPILANMEKCTAYIDEAGDLGAKRGTRWFVLSAVVIANANEKAIRAKINAIKERLNLRKIHMKEVRDFYKRAYIVREVADERFTYMNVVFDSSQFDTSKIPSAVVAYNYICKYLLQRISCHLVMENRCCDVVLSARGTSRDGELIRYINEKLLPYPDNDIEQSRFGKVSARSASEWDMLQLADICATTTFWSYESNSLGFCTPCFSMALKNHLCAANGRLEPFGIKFFNKTMRPNLEELHKRRPCATK